MERRHSDTMTTEYHDNTEEESSFFWTKESSVSLSAVSRFRRWLFPALTAMFILILIIALGASNTSTWSRLGSVEDSVSNLTDRLSVSHKMTQESARSLHRLIFAVESNKEQLTSVGEALKQLSTLESISRTVASLKCTLERIINNGTLGDGCCPLDWVKFGSSCYFFSKTSLSWDEARNWCNGHESHLVILHTDKDWDFVVFHASGVFYWIGLTDERTGNWEWVNQTPYVMNRSRWRPGQPDSWTNHGLGSGDEDCAHLHSDGRLNDLHCLSQLRYICQRHITRS